MRNSGGFYKLDSDFLLYAPNYVLNANYELENNTHNQHIYPIDGWYWFDSVEDAYVKLDIPFEPVDAQVIGLP
jgi:hypothetical protein